MRRTPLAGRLALVAAAVLAPLSMANAGVIPFSGDVAASTEMTGANFSGTIDYTFIAGNSGTLVISLTNTTPVGVGGYLTAFVFNAGSSDPGISVALTNTTDADFLDAAGANGQPFGNPFLAGAGLGGTFEGGGAPQPGLAVGASATFTFAVTALDANLLDEFSFFEGPYDYNFVVRFRGLDPEDPGSDKVPGVPTPGAMTLLGAAGLMTVRRRR